MNNNQKKIIEVVSRELFIVNNLPGIWEKSEAAKSYGDTGYIIKRVDNNTHTDDWISEDETVTIVAADCRDEQHERGGPLIAIEKTIDGDRFRIMGKGTTIYKRGQCEGNGYMCTDDKECKVWVEKDRMVSVLPSPGHEQAWAEIQCTEECMKEELKINTDSGEHPISNFTYVEWDKTMKEETAVQSDMGILEKWVEMEKSQPNIFKEANERIEKQAQETMDKLRKGEKVTWAAAYKDAGVKDPMEAGIEATIKGLTDMPTIRTVPIWNDRDVEGEPGVMDDEYWKECEIGRNAQRTGRVDSDDEGYGASMYLQDGSVGNTTESINSTGAEYIVAGNLIIKQGDGSHTFSMNNDKPYTGVEIVTPTVTSDSNSVGMIWKDDKWVATPDDKTNPFSDKYPVQSKEVVPVYNSLEEISEDISIARGKWDHDSADKELDEILEKLQNTINNGCYICQNPTE